MTVSIKKLAGATDVIGSTLANMRITNSDSLLKAASTSAQRKNLAKQTGVSEKALLELANRADLSRIKGVAGVFSDLLEQAGVDTVKELAMRRPENLHAKMLEVNQQRGLAKRVPTPTEVDRWVDQARKMPKILSY